MKNNFYIVIMAGGKGTRLWPLSRNAKPKQLQKLIGELSMIQETYDRVAKIVPPTQIFISTNTDYEKEIHKQLPKVPKANYIIEPIARNTAPAIGLIAAKIYARNKQAIITTIASDHVVNKVDVFINAVKACQQFLLTHPTMVGTIGIKPTSPHTGFGYIQKQKYVAEINDLEIYKVKQFVEKPDLATAKKYVASNNYFWNASYFTFNAKFVLDMIKKYQPQLSIHLDAIAKAIGTSKETSVIKQQFLKIPELAFDYIVEDLEEVFVVPADLGWDDVGSWEAIKNIISSNSNTDIVERGHHIGIDNKDCLIYAQDKLIATIGLKNIVIVDTDDVVLVCDKSRSQDIKTIVEKLKEDKKLNQYL